MLTPQIFETPIRAVREKIQWYSIVVSYFDKGFKWRIGNVEKSGRWVIEEEVKQTNRANAINTYQRFINHYGRYSKSVKINIYAQHNGYRDRIDEMIIRKLYKKKRWEKKQTSQI